MEEDEEVSSEEFSENRKSTQLVAQEGPPCGARPLWGGPSAFTQGTFRHKAPKWKSQFYEAFDFNFGFWALPGDAQ